MKFLVCDMGIVIADLSTIVESGFVDVELLMSVANESFCFELFLDIIDQCVCADAEEEEEGTTVFFELVGVNQRSCASCHGTLRTVTISCTCDWRRCGDQRTCTRVRGDPF